jgi:hypothetical protein
MVSPHKKTQAVAAAPDAARSFPWLEGALAVSAVALFFQLFPGIWANIVWFLALVFSYIDVREWTWRSYATASVVAIISLVALKAWLERDT